MPIQPPPTQPTKPVSLSLHPPEQGELEAYHNVDERWRVVMREVGAIETEANTPLEPDRAVALGEGAALSITCVDNEHQVQGASFRRRPTGGKRGRP